MMLEKSSILTLMTFVVALTAVSRSQSESKRNTIQGVVVWKEDSLEMSTRHPIEDAYAVAYDSTNKIVSLSNITGTDGKFTIVVPNSVKVFKLQVHQKQARYWDYFPGDLIPNETHPHNLGYIVLNNKHELSEAEAVSQVRAASSLYELQDSSAALLLDRATQAFLLQYEPPANSACPQSPMELLVSYPQTRRLTSRSEVLRGDWLLNARAALDSIRAAASLQQKFFKTHGFYQGGPQFLDDAMRELGIKTLEPPGYCIEPLVGTIKDKSFRVDPDERRPNYYVLLATPHSPAIDAVYLYIDPSGVVRYSIGLKTDFRESSAVKPDFPLGVLR